MDRTAQERKKKQKQKERKQQQASKLKICDAVKALNNNKTTQHSSS